MSWHYRILHYLDSRNPKGWYGLYEVYLRGEGLPQYWTSKPTDFTAATAQGVQEMLEIALADVKHRSVLKIVRDEKGNKRLEEEVPNIPEEVKP